MKRTFLNGDDLELRAYLAELATTSLYSLTDSLTAVFFMKAYFAPFGTSNTRRLAIANVKRTNPRLWQRIKINLYTGQC